MGVSAQPCFFLVGVPKAGTTSLADYLHRHPEAFVSFPKEPHYFGDDHPDTIRHADTLAEYLALFDQAPAGTVACGDASVMSMYSQTAVAAMVRFNREARFIVMLRNPLELLPSYHAQLVYGYVEKEQDFAAAWARRYEREEMGKRNPRAPSSLMAYHQIGRLGEQTARLLEVVPAHQVLFIDFEEFIGDPEHGYLAAQDFLGLSPHRLDSYAHLNRFKQQRIQWLGRLLHPRNRVYQRSIRRAKQWLGIREFGILRRLERLNLTSSKPPAVPAAIQADMLAEFSEDFAQLGLLVGRSYQHWKEIPSPIA